MHLLRRLRDLEPWHRTLAVMFVATLLTTVGFSMIFPFLPNYVNALGSGLGLNLVFLAGAVFSAQAISMMLASPVWGAVADRVGRKPMVLRAMFGGAVITLLMAFVQNAEQLVLLRVVQGMITGVISSANALVASQAPKARAGFALGSLQTATTSGVALGPVVGGVLADLYGYSAAFIITGGLLALGGVLVQFGVREEFTPPDDARGFSPREMVGDWAHVFRTPGVSTTFAARFTAWLARGTLVPVLPLFIPFLLAGGERIGTFTGLVIGVAAASATLSALYLGDLSDRIGHRSVLIGSALFAAVVYAPMAFVTAGWHLLVLNALAGVALGGMMPSLSALLSTVTADGEVGSAFGLDNAVVAASRAVAPLVGVGIATIVGAWAGEAAGYRAVFGASSVLFVATIFIAGSLQPARRAVPAATGD